jgi:CubicO group peptidase (beta-lactamase class C family)
MSARRRATALAVVLAWVTVLAIGAPVLAAPGEGQASGPTSELQQAYPLHQERQCCAKLTPHSGANATKERVAVINGSRQGGTSDGGSGGPPTLIMFAVGAGLVLAVLAGTIALLRRTAGPEVAVPARAESLRRSFPSPIEERHRLVVPPGLIRLGRPILHYIYAWDGYVLRLIGDRHGPVLEPGPRGEARSRAPPGYPPSPEGSGIAKLPLPPRIRRRHHVHTEGAKSAPQQGGWVAPGFEEVGVEFERNFVERGEIGAAVAAYWRGRKVVDLWGGRRTTTGDEPWNEDTLVVVNSTTKGLAAMTIAVANSRGWIDYDETVAEYWPDFAQHGKGLITVRQLLGHGAGLVWIDEPLHVENLRDLDSLSRVLARQKRAWELRTRPGYHAMTIGLYMQELIRHVDPEHRTLGRFFDEEIARPLQIEFYIGLPPEIPDERLAQLKLFSPTRAIGALRSSPIPMVMGIFSPWSLLRKSMLFEDLDPNDRRSLEIEIPAGNGVGTARAIARAYSAFAEGGAELGLTPATLASLTAVQEVERLMDAVMGMPSWLSLGYIRPGPELAFGSSQRAFGTRGAGGSFGFADPDARLGFAYVMNKMNSYFFDDPREKPLRDAVHRSIQRLSGQRRGTAVVPTRMSDVSRSSVDRGHERRRRR